MEYKGKSLTLLSYKPKDQEYLNKALHENPNGVLVCDVLLDALKEPMAEMIPYHLTWIIESEGTRLGVLVLQKISHQHQSGELILIFNDTDFYADQDLIQNILTLLTEEIFVGISLIRLQGIVLESHLRLKEAYNNFGFLEEGLLRSKFKVKDKRYDAYVMSLLKIEWERSKK